MGIFLELTVVFVSVALLVMEPPELLCGPSGARRLWLPLTRDFQPGLRIVSFLRKCFGSHSLHQQD